MVICHTVIRSATVDDIEGIRRVARTSWRRDYPPILSRETAESGIDEWYAPEVLESELARPRSVVAVAEGEDDIQGFVHGVSGDEIGHVLRVYADPAHRRQGIGWRLLEFVVDDMADFGFDRVAALVLADNEPGISFYRSLGFETVDEAETRIGGTAYRELTMERPINR